MTRVLCGEILGHRQLLTGILNGTFDVADASDPAFAWEVASAVVVDRRGVLEESDLQQPALRQTFALPGGANELELTIHQLALGHTAQQPPDTLEIALLDPQTFEPLVDPIQGIADADAFLNIDAEGHVRFGTGTTVPGVVDSGDIASLQFPITITTDLTGLAPDTQVLVAIELLTFGDVDSHLVLDDVRLTGDLPPELSLTIDAATDSGRPGDAYTNFTTINLTGRTDPDHEVTLDVDGDGFDDGMTTADSKGAFRFDGLIPAGTTNYRVRAENQHGPSIAERSVVVDTEPVAGALAVPDPQAIVYDDPGFVEVQWNDRGLSGVEGDSFGIDDISISGVDIDRAQTLAGGRVRYWYSDDGERLPYGPIQVRLEAGAVSDRAGNPSAESADLFRRLARGCAWQNAALREDTNIDRTVAPIDALIVINELNSRAAGGSSLLPPEPPAGVPFHLIDINCDGHVTPLDALVIINWLNSGAGG